MMNLHSNLRHGRPISPTPATSSPLISPPPAPSGAPAPGQSGAGAQVAEATAAPVPVTVTAVPVETARPPEPPLYPDEVTALALSPEQLVAIQKMLSGHSLGSSAGAAGVTRMTLYRWLHKDPKFRAAYNAWQVDAITSVRTKLLGMSDAAVTTIGRAVKSDARVALAVLKALGTLTPPEGGSSDPDEVEMAMDIERRKHERDLQDARSNLDDDPMAAIRELERMRDQEKAERKKQRGGK